MTQSHMVDAADVAKALDISVSAVYQLGKRNELPFESIKLGRIVRFRRKDVEAFLGGSLENTDTADNNHVRIDGQVLK